MFECFKNGLKRSMQPIEFKKDWYILLNFILNIYSKAEKANFTKKIIPYIKKIDKRQHRLSILSGSSLNVNYLLPH